MARRNPHFNTWSHPGRTDDYEPPFATREDNSTLSNSTLNSLDEASTLNHRYRQNSRSDSLTGSLADVEGETSEDEGKFEDVTLKKGDDLQSTHEVSETVAIDKSAEDVSDKLEALKLDAAEKETKTTVGGESSDISILNRVESNTDKQSHRLNLTRPESIAIIKPRSKNREFKRFQSTGGSLYQVDRPTDVFLLICSDGKTYTTGLISEFRKHNIKWYDFDKEFNPSHSMLYDLSVFLFSCKRTIAVLSPSFYQNRLFMYFLQTTVKYCVDHGRNALIPILAETKPSDIPIWLKAFRYFSISEHRNWTDDILEVLAEKVKPLTCKGDLLCNERFSTISSSKSEPPSLKIKLSKSTENEMKMWITRQFGQLPQEFQNKRFNACEDENIGITDKVNTERGVNKEILFANQLRQDNKKVYDSADTFIVEGFDVTPGDILEICETCEDGESVRVKNSRDQTTIMPKQKVLPNVYLLPKAAVEMVQNPASKKDNDEFEAELRLNGMKVYMAVDSPPLNSRLNFQINDIFTKIAEIGKFVKVKHCRNEILLLEKRYLKEK